MRPEQRLQRLLAWMAAQDFERLTAGQPSLIRQVELIVLDSHRRLYVAKGIPWSEPVAYRWLHYEDPMPVARLSDGLERLIYETCECGWRCCGQSVRGSGEVGIFELRSGVCILCGKEMPQETFLFTLKSPMRFSVSSHGLRRTFHLLDVRYPQVYRTQPLGASRKLTGA